MGQHRTSLLEKVLLRRARAFWSRAALAAGTTDLSVLRTQRNEARDIAPKA
jgi:hypothetical protein